MPAKEKPIKTNDYEVRRAVVRHLLVEGIARQNIRHELPLDTNSSGGRADIVLLLDDMLPCIELKSCKDILDNADRQLTDYGYAFDSCYLIISKRHADALEENGKFRQLWSWGKCYYCPEADELQELYLYRKYRPKENLKFDLRWNRWGPTAPMSMASLLWKKELDAEAGNLLVNTRIRSEALANIKENCALKAVRAAVLRQLRARELNKWEVAFWRKFDAEKKVDNCGTIADSDPAT